MRRILEQMLSGHSDTAVCLKSISLVHWTKKADWCYCKNQHFCGHKRLSFQSLNKKAGRFLLITAVWGQCLDLWIQSYKTCRRFGKDE